MSSERAMAERSAVDQETMAERVVDEGMATVDSRAVGDVYFLH